MGRREEFEGDRFGGDRFGGDRFGGDRFGGDRDVGDRDGERQADGRFGPGSLLWETHYTRLIYLVAPRAGLLQLLHPDVGRGVEEHSNFYDEPWERILRSSPQILRTIYGGADARSTASAIRSYHVEIRGRHGDGRRYSALAPETFLWTHVTFVDALVMAHEVYGHPFTAQERERLWGEAVEWWQMYGMRRDSIPASYDEMLEYWDHTVAEVLEPTVAASRLVELMRHPEEMRLPWFPPALWRVLAPLGGPVYRWLAVAVLPERVREMFGFVWSERDAWLFARARRLIGQGFGLLPDELAMFRQAREAYAREGRAGR